MKPGIVRLYYANYRLLCATGRLCRAVDALLRACFAGLWLGLLKRDTLLEIDDKYYSGTPHYRSDAYNRGGLFAWEQSMLARYFPGRRHLLVVGAGGGREVLALAQGGYDVHGVECNPDLVRAANLLLGEENVPVRVQHAPPDACPHNGVVYDGLMVGWGAYMLIQGRHRRVALLHSLRAQVRPGTPLLISFFVRSRNARRFHVTSWVGNTLRRLRRAEGIELGDALEPEYVHYFTREEIEAELRHGGFALEYYSEHHYGHAVALATESTAASSAAANINKASAESVRITA